MTFLMLVVSAPTLASCLATLIIPDLPSLANILAVRIIHGTEHEANARVLFNPNADPSGRPSAMIVIFAAQYPT